MNWFEEQIHARRDNDISALNSAYDSVVNSVLGEHFVFDEAEDALASIIRYYNLNSVKIPEGIQDENDKLAAACRMSGLMHRNVILDEDWYTCAFGAFLGRLKDSGEYVALLPNKMGRYSYFDKENHKRIPIGRKNADLLEREAVCFYKPLPSKKLSLADIVKFGLSSWSFADHFYTYFLLAVATLLGLAVPRLSYFLYSSVIGEGSKSLWLSTVIFLICINLSISIIESIRTLFSSRTKIKMTTALKGATMMRTLSLPTGFFRRFSTGEVMTRMNYMESVCSGTVEMLFSTALSGLFSLAYITQIFRYAPRLVVPSLLVVLTQMLFTLYSAFRQMRYSKRQMELAAKNSGTSIAMISGVQKIKMSGSEKRMFARWAKNFADEIRITYNPPVFNKYNSVIALAITLIGQFVIYYLSIGSDISVAEYYAFQTSYGMVSGAITAIVGIALQAAELKPSLEMLKPLLDEIPEDSGNTHEVTSLSGNIEINNVTFKYEDGQPNVIDDFSVKIRPGQYVAIVGKTGCGKSTLVRLLLGFEKPEKGAIYYDGRDVNTLEKRSLRQKIGVVIQDDKLFNGDIYSNIVICAPRLTLDDAWEAAELAGIADDIRDMPMGMHTVISDGSGGISGGQRQRIVIARAIAPKPKILIFDEATSALDNVTQKQVSESLDKLKCTRIVIAHRLSTIRHCDRILVMDKGHIVEDGKYDELIRSGGLFAELVKRQIVNAQSGEPMIF